MAPRPRRQPGEKSQSAGGVVKGGIACYVLAGLLNSGGIVDLAKLMPRDSAMRNRVALPLAEQLDDISGGLGLHGPSETLDRWRGRTEVGSDEFTFGQDAPGPSSEVTAVTVPDAGDVTASTTSTSTTLAPTTTTVAGPPSRTNRLRVYAAGDSLVQGWGEALQRLTGASGVIDMPAADFRSATGLVRPDAYDWPRRLRDQVKSRQPQVVVVGFGGNDAQGMEVDGRPYQVSDAVWRAEYARRVGSTMDFLAADGRSLIWVGTPMPRNSKDFANQAVINQIFRDEAAARPGVVFIDTWALFASPDGAYSDIIDVDGSALIVRQNDGFHLNVTGANRLAKAVFGEVAASVIARGGSI